MKYEQNRQNDSLGLTGLSNSRLSVHTVTQNLEIRVSFDRITVVGAFIPEREKWVKNHVETNTQINLRDTGFDRFICHALNNKVYVEYDKRKAQAMNRSEIRVEFNPNELNEEEKQFIQFMFLDNMRNKDFSRIDLAFDLDIDLTNYYAMTDKALKRTIFFGRDDKVETKYFGVRDSERYIRIYNKKKQLSDVKKEEITADHLWRIEFELKRSMTNKWDKCLDDMHIIMPAWKTIENHQKRAMIYMLLHEEDEWTNLERRTKYRYKKLLKEISDINIADDLRQVLKSKRQQLSEELNQYIGISHHDKMYYFDFMN